MWTSWGSLLGILAAVVDRNFIWAVIWPGVGLSIGLFSPAIFNAVSTPILEWYDNFRTTSDRKVRLRDNWLRGWPKNEYEAYISDHTFSAYMGLAPVFGIFHGTLWGPLIGGLLTLHPDWQAATWQGALLGVAVGPAVISI